MRILTEPRNAITKQYSKFLSLDKVELVFTDDALEAAAEKALELKTGARGLRTIIEEVLLDVMYEIPSRNDVRKCVITARHDQERQGAATAGAVRAADRPDGAARGPVGVALLVKKLERGRAPMGARPFFVSAGRPHRPGPLRGANIWCDVV